MTKTIEQLIDEVQVDWYVKVPQKPIDPFIEGMRKTTMRFSLITNQLVQMAVQAPSSQMEIKIRKILEKVIDDVGRFASRKLTNKVVDAYRLENMRDKMQKEIMSN